MWSSVVIRHATIATAGVALVLSATVVTEAQTVTGSLTVTATVSAGGGACSVNSPVLSFGNYSGLAAQTTAPVTVTCAAGLPYTISLGPGLTPDPIGGILARRMQRVGGGPDLLAYSLTAPDGAPWGNVEQGLHWWDVGSGSPQNHPVTGSVPSGQSPSQGDYQDVVTIIVAF